MNLYRQEIRKKGPNVKHSAQNRDGSFVVCGFFTIKISDSSTDWSSLPLGWRTTLEEYIFFLSSLRTENRMSVSLKWFIQNSWYQKTRRDTREGNLLFEWVKFGFLKGCLTQTNLLNILNYSNNHIRALLELIVVLKDFEFLKKLSDRCSVNIYWNNNNKDNNNFRFYRLIDVVYMLKVHNY